MRLLVLSLVVCFFTVKAEVVGKEEMKKFEVLKYREPQRALLYLDSLRKVGEWRAQGREFKLDMMQMEVYGIMGWDYLATAIGEKLLRQDSVLSSDPYFFIVTNSLMAGYFKLEKYGKAINCADLLLERARKVKDEWSIASAYFTLGQIKWRLEDKEKAERYFVRTLEILEHRKTTGSITLLSYVYGEMMGYYVEEKKYRIALEIGKKREDLIRVMESYGGREEYVEQQKGYLFLKMAYVYYSIGKKQLARRYFERYQETWFSATLEGHFYQIPYLRLVGEANRVVNILEGLPERIVRDKQDSVGWDMINCMEGLGWAYSRLGNYRKAYDCAFRRGVLLDSLNGRMRRNSLMEMSVVYGVKEQEKQIQERELALGEKQFHIRMLIIGVVGLSGCLFGIGMHVYSIRRKNRKLMEQIRANTLVYREKRMLPGNKPDKVRDLFLRFERLMQEEKLFLLPALSRDEVVSRLFTNKNNLSTAIRLYTKGGFTDYIKKLRLEYALNLLMDEQNYTMEVIAEKSGFGTVRSFYRIFKEKYSISPSVYKRFLMSG